MVEVILSQNLCIVYRWFSYHHIAPSDEALPLRTPCLRSKPYALTRRPQIISWDLIRWRWPRRTQRMMNGWLGSVTNGCLGSIHVFNLTFCMKCTVPSVSGASVDPYTFLYIKGRKILGLSICIVSPKINQFGKIVIGTCTNCNHHEYSILRR